jgi:hypothetical protein
MIASAPSFRNGLRRVSGEWVCLRVDRLGSIRCSGEGEHGVRPYNICVGANSMFAPRSETEFQEVT